MNPLSTQPRSPMIKMATDYYANLFTAEGLTFKIDVLS